MDQGELHCIASPHFMICREKLAVILNRSAEGLGVRLGFTGPWGREDFGLSY